MKGRSPNSASATFFASSLVLNRQYVLGERRDEPGLSGTIRRDVTFQSEDDFARALAAINRMSDPEKNGKNRASPAKNGYDALKGASAFLEELAAHREGVQSPTIAEALECSPRGIGRRLMSVDAILKPLGFKRDRVYDDSKRLAKGGRVYMPGPDVQPALEAVKRKVGG